MVRRLLIAALAALAALVTPAAADAAEALHGANAHPLWWGVTTRDQERELDVLQRSGANSVRVDFAWSSFETNGDDRYSRWYVEKMDTYVRLARERGIKVVPAIYATPCWAAAAPESVKQGCEGEWWDRDVQAYPPRDPDELGEAVAYMADRWGADLGGIEIWTEPNEDDQRFLRADDIAGTYARMVRASYPRIKEQAPDLPVVVGSILFSNVEFLEELYDEGIRGHFDAISIHPYNEWRDPYDPWKPEWRRYTFITGIPSMHEVMSRHGDGDKQLWLTEFGWATCGDLDKFCTEPGLQGTFLANAFQIAGGWRFVGGAFSYELRDGGTDTTDRESVFGVLTHDFREKPGLAGFARGQELFRVARAAIGGDTGSGVAAGAGSGTPTGRGRLQLVGQRRLRLRRDRRVTLRVRCHGEPGASCTGTLSLLVRSSRGQRSLGAARVSTVAGSGRAVRLRVSRGGWRRVARRGRRVRATAVAVPAAGGATTTRAVVLVARR